MNGAQIVARILEQEGVEYVFGLCGHTHLPRLERRGNLLLFNPGSPALPKGEGPTVGTIEIADGHPLVRLHDLESGSLIQELA